MRMPSPFYKEKHNTDTNGQTTEKTGRDLQIVLKTIDY